MKINYGVKQRFFTKKIKDNKYLLIFEFSKNIQNILSKTHEIIENHSTTMYESIEKFVILYEMFNKEFKEAQSAIKTQIIEQILKQTNDLFNKEKEYYNS